MKKYVKSNYTLSDAPDIVVSSIGYILDTYDKISRLPKPEEERYVDQYYGSTPLYTTRGNMLEFLDDEPVDIYFYGTTFNYEHAWVVRVGGAYSKDEDAKYWIDDLRLYLKQNKQALWDAGYAIVDKYGTNYCTYGIAQR